MNVTPFICGLLWLREMGGAWEKTEQLLHDCRAVETQGEQQSRRGWVNIMGHARSEWTTAVWSFIPERADVCCWISLDNTTALKRRLHSPALKFRIMRVNFSASWIFQGWITHFVLALCTQVGLLKCLHMILIKSNLFLNCMGLI